jgi:hypothetical protein
MFLQHSVQEKLEGKAGAVDPALAAPLIRLAKSWRTPGLEAHADDRLRKKDLTDLSYCMGQVLSISSYKSQGERGSWRRPAASIEDRAPGATAAQFVDHVKKARHQCLDRIFEDWVFTGRGDHLGGDVARRDRPALSIGANR